MSTDAPDLLCYIKLLLNALKNLDTFTRKSAHESKMNAVVRTQLTFQMLT